MRENTKALGAVWVSSCFPGAQDLIPHLLPTVNSHGVPDGVTDTIRGGKTQSRNSRKQQKDPVDSTFPPLLGSHLWVVWYFQPSSFLCLEQWLWFKPLPAAEALSIPKLVCHITHKFSHSRSSQCTQHTGCSTTTLKDCTSISPMRIKRKGHYRCPFLTTEPSPGPQLPVSLPTPPRGAPLHEAT